MRTSYLPVIHCEKMAVTDMFHQGPVIEFILKKGNSAGVIFVVCMEMSAWVPAVSELGETFEGRKHGHRPSAALWSNENCCN
jgi:hypothetical protein